MVKLFLLDEADSFTEELWNDYHNRRICFSQRIKEKYPYMFVSKDTLPFREKVVHDEKGRYSLLMESREKLLPKHMKALGLLTLENVLDIEISRRFVEKEVFVIQPAAANPHTVDQSDIPIADQVYLRRMADLLIYLNNKFVDKPLVVVDNGELYRQRVNIVLNKKMDYQDTWKVLKKCGFVTVQATREVEMLHME